MSVENILLKNPNTSIEYRSFFKGNDARSRNTQPLANMNIPNKNITVQIIKSSKKTCKIGLVCDAERLSDVRRNRIQSMHEDRPGDYTDEKKIIDELESSKKLFKKYNWPIIDVTRKSVEETAASIIKILDILNSK